MYCTFAQAVLLRLQPVACTVLLSRLIICNMILCGLFLCVHFLCSTVVCKIIVVQAGVEAHCQH